MAIFIETGDTKFLPLPATSVFTQGENKCIMNKDKSWENIHMKRKTESILICAFVALCFLWTGSGYLTWLYHLLSFYPASSVDIYTEIIGYLFQICGLILFSFCMKKRQKAFTTTHASISAMLADLIFMILSVLSPNGAGALFFGYLMNLFHGIVAVIYLTKLTTQIPQQKRGIVFGVGYGFGSIGSWFISLIGNGNFMKSSYVLILYTLLMLLSAVVLCILNRNSEETHVLSKPGFSIDVSVIVLAGITVFMISCIKNIGFYFPTADLSNSSFSLEFSRAFYAVGLIVAGFINDKNRKWGAVCCIAALVFPFAMFILQNSFNSSLIIWIVGYIFFGFFSVYRVILFSDMAGKSAQYLYFAGIGLMFGRCGDVVGTSFGILLSNHTIVLVLCTSVAFMITIFLFVNLYQKIYVTMPTVTRDREDLLKNFEICYRLTSREMEVFQFLLDNHSNTEIAEKLFISENTVKFHIKNIFKKTGCSDRISLKKIFMEQK